MYMIVMFQILIRLLLNTSHCEFDSVCLSVCLSVSFIVRVDSFTLNVTLILTSRQISIFSAAMGQFRHSIEHIYIG